MREITEAQLKAGVSAIKDGRRPKSRTAQREILAKRFRHGIDGRRKALEQLATIAQPYTPTFITLNSPFLIWANRFLPHSDEPLGTDILIDSHIEPLNNWAKILLNYATDEVFFATDRLDFYFFWRNETGSDAVVNIASYLTLNGSCRVHANSSILHGWLTPPTSQVSIDAELSVFEWWNQPPTEPLAESGQLQNVTTLQAQGGEFSGDGKSALVSANSQLTYNIFRIPSNDVAVFEVGLSLKYGVQEGDVNVDFSFEDNLVLCPYLQLEVLTVPTNATSSVGSTLRTSPKPHLGGRRSSRRSR
jgi:hypothetical protein